MPLIIQKEKCTGCGLCVNSCPFGALTLVGGVPEVNAACKMCGICVKACPEKVFILEKKPKKALDKTKWKGFLVVAEQSMGELHPVTFELLGQSLRLAESSGEPVAVMVIGHGMDAAARELIAHGASRVYVYDDAEYEHYRVDAYTPAVIHCIKKMRPSVVLVGSTEIGRSLAPRVAARLGTGLTADCTELEYRDHGLTQIRPAFGGNIMARIVTPDHRPQFATVRYRIFDKASCIDNPTGEIVACRVDEPISSVIEIVEAKPRAKQSDLSDAEVIVAGGRGLKSPQDMALLSSLADVLGAEIAVTRPLAESGYAPQSRQIGLSGRTVKPRLIFACGISGAIQFQAGMNTAEHIVAINTDPDAAIFDIAHFGIVGDLYEVIPALVESLKGGTDLCSVE